MIDYNIVLFKHIVENPYDNQDAIDALVLDSLLAGLGVKGATELRNILPANPKIIIKPNWVVHRPFKQGTLECLITNPTVIKAVVKAIQVVEPRSVIIGDSPIQYCDFASIVTDKLVHEINDLSNTNVIFADFRRFELATKEDLRTGLIENRDISNYTKFDLKHESLLDPITSKQSNFQITNYDVRDPRTHHQRGKHQYLICNEALEADLIINLPKLKMHRLSGYTGAIKNFVGCVGDKTYLPHFRFGGTSIGGDSFPGFHLFKVLADLCINRRNQLIPNIVKYSKWEEFSRFFLRLDLFLSKLIKKNYQQIQFGAWSGNDTVWRTVMDIFRIIEFGDKTGAIHSVKQRRIWTFTDALICGEGNGPLNPTPKNLGLLTFSTSAIALDIFHGYLVGYTPQEVKFLEHLVKLIEPDEIRVLFEEKTYKLQDILELLPVNFKRPNNW